MKTIIVNADDFGISPGVNKAITEGCKKGIINSTSLMVNLPCTGDAVKLYKKELDGLNIGLHTNLTNEKSVSKSCDIPLLVDKEGKFKNGFVKLFILSLIQPKRFKQQVEIEVEAQILRAKKLEINLTHIDSHRHVHMIPSIFKVVKKLADKYNINRIRVVNESFFYSILNPTLSPASQGGSESNVKIQHNLNNNFSFLYDGGLIKYLVLKTFAFWNNCKTDTYFYSILYSGKIFKERVKKLKIPKKYSTLELCIHPNIKGIDVYNDTCIFDKNIVSENRFREMETALDKTIYENNN